MSRGLTDAGIDVVRAYDAWPVAIDTYRANLGRHAEVVDLKDLLTIIPQICRLAPEIICGGPPCQDYSLAGNRREGENASLTVAYAIIVAAVRPQWFLMENVIQAQSSAAWSEARSILKRAGYGLTESKLNASHYGVPQARRRFFCIGRLGEKDGFLRSAIAGAASGRPMTLRDFFGATSVPGAILPSALKSCMDDAALLENGFVYSRPVRGGRGVRSVDEPFPTVTRTSWERPAPKYLSNPHPDDPVPAQSTAPITRDQASRIQGFVRDWQWIAPTQRDILQMIANAVPAPVARTLGQVILARQNGDTMPAIEGRFLDWLVKGGRTRATARNVKASVNRARRMLGGRTFEDGSVEIATLETVDSFKSLSKGTRSDLRQALRLHADFVTSNACKRRKPRAEGEAAGLAADRVDIGLAA
jgi:DNA (cytosine-5)-methyltransferase 1